MKQTIRLTENRLKQIIKESVLKVLKESEDGALEQAVEKCRRPYRTYKDLGRECDELLETYEKLEGEASARGRKIGRMIQERREKQYKLLEFIINIVNEASEAGDLLEISWGENEGDNLYDGPWLEDSDNGSYVYDDFARVFYCAMSKGITLSQAKSDVESQKNADRERWAREEEETKQHQLQRMRDDVNSVPGQKWDDNYKAPSDSPLKTIGKIKLSDKDLNKKRW